MYIKSYCLFPLFLHMSRVLNNPELYIGWSKLRTISGLVFKYLETITNKNVILTKITTVTLFSTGMYILISLSRLVAASG